MYSLTATVAPSWFWRARYSTPEPVSPSTCKTSKSSIRSPGWSVWLPLRDSGPTGGRGSDKFIAEALEQNRGLTAWNVYFAALVRLFGRFVSPGLGGATLPRLVQRRWYCWAPKST